MRVRNVFVLMIILLIATQSRVLAYTDPGSGTLIWQLLVAGSLGASFYLNRVVKWVRNFKNKARHGAFDNSKPE